VEPAVKESDRLPAQNPFSSASADGAVFPEEDMEHDRPVAATLSAQDAGAQRWDVIVVGAGPAGSTVARTLAARGLAVLLLDRAEFPRAKVCGCCLNGAALGALHSCGLGELPRRLGAVPLREFVFTVAARREPALRLQLPGGFALSRAVFDAALVRAAIAAGAHFRPRAAAALDPTAGDTRAVRFTDGDAEFVARASIVVAADGLGGRFLRDEPGFEPRVAPAARVGVGAVAPDGPEYYRSGVIYMACAPGGYVGVVRLERGRLDIAAAVDPALVRRAGGPATAVAGILRAAGLPWSDRFDELRWQGTALLTRRRRRLAGRRVFVVGDAAGYVEPFTGEGMAWALESGVAVASLLERAVRNWSPELSGKWAARYRALLASRQRWCRAVAAVLRRPRLTRLACAVVGSFPQLAAPYLTKISRTVA
jgi:flavin-dependent dehydrogenase